MHPKFSVIFRKTPSFFTKTPKKSDFSFSSKIKDIKTNFQPIFHTGHTIRTGPSGNAAGGDTRKKPAALLFS